MTAEPGKGEQRHSCPAVVESADISEQSQLKPIVACQSNTATADKRRFDANIDIADSFLHLAALPTLPLDRFSRYEHTLWRQARQLVLTLESNSPPQTNLESSTTVFFVRPRHFQ